MKVLLIVDMQEIYVGKERNKKIFRYEAEQLIDRINERIKEYDAKNVFYILNVFKNTWLKRLVPVIA
jgi:nicotinamidase-related amidase